jgi:hypothetical protein
MAETPHAWYDDRDKTPLYITIAEVRMSCTIKQLKQQTCPSEFNSLLPTTDQTLHPVYSTAANSS